VGIDFAAARALNGVMPRYLLITALAVLCACHPIRRYPSTDVASPKPDQQSPVRVIDPPAPVETEPTPIPVVPSPPPVSKKPTPPNVDQIITSTNAALLDAFFPYDRSELTGDAIAALRKDADLLRTIFAEYPGLQLIVEGHCDERGSAEYNLGLGDRRAQRAADLL
jgi:peptidoglycan-associated lipoprotein